MQVNCSQLREALETQDKLAIYAEFHNIFEYIMHGVVSRSISSKKEQANASVQLLTEVQTILKELSENIKEEDKNKTLGSLQILEALCERL